MENISGIQRIDQSLPDELGEQEALQGRIDVMTDSEPFHQFHGGSSQDQASTSYSWLHHQFGHDSDPISSMNQGLIYPDPSFGEYWAQVPSNPQSDDSFLSGSASAPSTSIPAPNPFHCEPPLHLNQSLDLNNPYPDQNPGRIDWQHQPMTSTSALPFNSSHIQSQLCGHQSINPSFEQSQSSIPTDLRGKGRAFDLGSAPNHVVSSSASAPINPNKESKNRSRTRVACLPCRGAKRKCSPREGNEFGEGICEPCRKRNLGEQDCRYQRTDKAKEAQDLSKIEDHSDSHDREESDDDGDGDGKERRRKKSRTSSHRDLPNPLLLNFSSQPPARRRKSLTSLTSSIMTSTDGSSNLTKELEKFIPKDTFDKNLSEGSKFDEIKNRFFHPLPIKAQSYASDLELVRAKAKTAISKEETEGNCPTQ